MDHAGIATQVVVEKRLKKLENKCRHDYTRKEFIDKVWEWKTEYGNKIANQLTSLGISSDPSQTFFTLDERMCKAVNTAFMELFEKNYLRRAEKLVNWSCALSSAISKIEVEMIPINGSTMIKVPNYEKKVEFGVLHYFSYRVENEEDRKITVATTRIETMLGDAAIAVNPDDSKYKDLIGKEVWHPFGQRKIPIIADSHVDIEFGTGAVKITPAHDYNDYEIAMRHNFPKSTMYRVIDDNGLISENNGQFSGMKRFDARKAIVDELTKLGLYERKTDHNYEIPICSRSKDVIEPLLKKQWFVSCKEVAKRSNDLVKNGEMKILPEAFERIWDMWMTKCEDWCVSRQLWWGHQIPAYRIIAKTEKLGGSMDDNEIHGFDGECSEKWVTGLSESHAADKVMKKYKLKADEFSLEQDPDVLDTWFSSGLLPFSAMGWPDCKMGEGNMKFFPNSLMETGGDIIFFWVARMVLFSLVLFDKAPFETVYLHSMVRDAFGRKMSKSLGNVVDPFFVIQGASLEELNKTLHEGNLDPREIEKATAGQKKTYPEGIPICGADALRFSLCDFNISPKDLNLDILQIQAKRAFCNKIWNAHKLVMRSIGEDYTPPSETPSVHNLNNVDKWILLCLQQTISSCHQGFREYDFPSATYSIYHFCMSKFCDVYLEWIKSPEALNECSKYVLWKCFRSFLLLIHPFMPFLTEELFQRIPRDPMHRQIEDDMYSICNAEYPSTKEIEGLMQANDGLLVDFKLSMDLIKEIRSMRVSIFLNKEITRVNLTNVDQNHANAFKNFKNLINHVSKSSIQINGDLQNSNGKTEKSFSKDLENFKIEINIPDGFDFSKTTEVLSKQSEKLTKQLNQLNASQEKIKNAGKNEDAKNKLKQQKLENEITALSNLIANLTA